MDIVGLLTRDLGHLSRAAAEAAVRGQWAPTTLASHQRHWCTFITELAHLGDQPAPSTAAAWVPLLERFLERRFAEPSAPDEPRAREAKDVAATVRTIVLRVDPLSPFDADRSWAASRGLEAAIWARRCPNRSGPSAPVAVRDTSPTVFDARRIILHWANQPDNEQLTTSELRLKTLCLHAVDRIARVSSLEGTMRDHVQIRDTGLGFNELLVSTFSPKGRRDRWFPERPIAAFPFCPRVCTVTTTLAYIARTDEEARAAAAEAAAARAADPSRARGRGNSGFGVPLFVTLPTDNRGREDPSSRQRARAILAATIAHRLREVIADFERPPPTAHRIRHSGASTLAHLGVREQEIIALGAWTSQEMLRRVYNHALHDPVPPRDWAAVRPDPAGSAVQLPEGMDMPLSWVLREPLINTRRRRATGAPATADAENVPHPKRTRRG